MCVRQARKVEIMEKAPWAGDDLLARAGGAVVCQAKGHAVADGRGTWEKLLTGDLQTWFGTRCCGIQRNPIARCGPQTPVASPDPNPERRHENLTQRRMCSMMLWHGGKHLAPSYLRPWMPLHPRLLSHLPQQARPLAEQRKSMVNAAAAARMTKAKVEEMRARKSLSALVCIAAGHTRVPQELPLSCLASCDLSSSSAAVCLSVCDCLYLSFMCLSLCEVEVKAKKRKTTRSRGQTNEQKTTILRSLFDENLGRRREPSLVLVIGMMVPILNR